VKSPTLDKEILTSAIKAIEAKIAPNEWHELNKKLNADLIKNLLEVADGLKLSDYRISDLAHDHAQMIANGVAISVRPELLLEKEVRGETVYGGVKSSLYTATHYLL